MSLTCRRPRKRQCLNSSGNFISILSEDPPASAFQGAEQPPAAPFSGEAGWRLPAGCLKRTQEHLKKLSLEASLRWEQPSRSSRARPVSFGNRPRRAVPREELGCACGKNRGRQCQKVGTEGKSGEAGTVASERGADAESEEDEWEEAAECRGNTTAGVSECKEGAETGSDSESYCRFCFCSEGEDLISPCRCSGTQKLVHRSCLDEWRAAKGKFAFTNCSTCRAPFHLRMPLRRPQSFLILGASRWTLHFLAAALMFISVQLLAVGWGYLLGRTSDFGSIHSLHLDLSTRRGLFCYCVGIWEVLFVIVVSHNNVVLHLDNWFWRGSYFGATSVLQYSVFPLAMESIFQACELHRTVLPASFPLLHLLKPLPRDLRALVPVPAAEPPFPLSLFCNRRFLELSCAGTACSLYVAGVVLSVALGIILGGYAGYGLLAAMEAQSREVPASLVKEFEVMDCKGEYTPPEFSAGEKRLLRALLFLS